MTIWFSVQYNDADLYKLKIMIKGKTFEYPAPITKKEIIDLITGVEEDES